MRHIEVKEFVAPVGKEYDVSVYPGRGAYLNIENNTLFFVLCPVGSALPYVSSMAVGTASSMLVELPEPTLELTSNPGFSEDFILKALAIAQSPQLAVNLLVKPA